MISPKFDNRGCLRIGCHYEKFGSNLFPFHSCSLLMKIGNQAIIHFEACKVASQQTYQQFSLQRPRPPQAALSWALPGQNVELSSSSFLCNPRSKVPGKWEWILRSNKHTLRWKKLNPFFFIFLLQVSSVSSLKDRLRNDSAVLSLCRTWTMSPGASLALGYLLSTPVFMLHRKTGDDKQKTVSSALQRKEMSQLFTYI